MKQEKNNMKLETRLKMNLSADRDYAKPRGPRS